MSDDIKCYLKSLLDSVDGLHCILITDKNGIPIIKVSDDISTDQFLKANYSTNFQKTVDQSVVLGLGRNKYVICELPSYQMIQMNKYPLILTFVASEVTNTGHIFSLETKIEPILMDLVNIVDDNCVIQSI